MAILIDGDSRIIVQGMTGREGRFYTQRMLAYGTNIVGGVTPGKGGEWAEGKPVFDTVRAAQNATGADTSIIFVPAASAIDAIYEAIDAQLRLVICITEGIPILDMMKVKNYLHDAPTVLVGPNCAGILCPDLAVVGTIPDYIASKGHVGIISRSGILMYEMVYQMTGHGIGQSTIVGIGADPISGTDFVDVLERFESDPDTSKIVLIGEIGGDAEQRAARYIKNHMTKPIIAYVAGISAPYNVSMGHIGAFVETASDTAQNKIKKLQEVGVRILENPIDDLIPLLS